MEIKENLLLTGLFRRGFDSLIDRHFFLNCPYWFNTPTDSLARGDTTYLFKVSLKPERVFPILNVRVAKNVSK